MTITKKTLLVLFFATSFFASQAQQNYFEVGVLTGLNWTSLRENVFPKYFDYHVSYVGGVSFQHNINDKFAISTNIAYESKGCSGKNMATRNVEDVLNKEKNFFIFRYEYLTVPLLFKYSVGDYSKFFVNAGPYVGYLLNYEERLDDYTIDRTSDMRSTDFGITTGIGLFAPITDRWGLTLEIRNNFGLTDVREDNKTYETVTKHPAYELLVVKTTSTNFLMGLQYKIK